MRALIAITMIVLLLIAAGCEIHAGIWGHPFSIWALVGMVMILIAIAIGILALAIWGLGDHDEVDSLDVD